MKNNIYQLIVKILNHEASAEDIISFSQWLSEGENNRDEFRILKSYWDGEITFIHNINPDLSYEKTIQKIHSEQKTGKTKKRIIWGFSVAASFLFLTGAGLLLTNKTF